MRLLKWLQSRHRFILLTGLTLTFIFWIIISRGFQHRPKPPRHFFDVNPVKGQHFYQFDQDLPIEINQIETNHAQRDRENLKVNPHNKNPVLLMPLGHGHPMDPEPRDKIKEPLLQIDSEIQDSVFKEALTYSADAQRNVMLSIVDIKFLEFALNFYEGSLQPNNIRNFLYICTDKATKEELHVNNIDCFHYGFSILGGDKNSTTFGSASYYAKTNIKTKIMLHALSLGFKVLLVDLDVVLFKNPWPYLLNATYDLQISMDRVQWNTGFMYAHPTKASIKLFETAWKFFKDHPKSHDQAYVNMALKPMVKNKTIHILELSTRLFPNGYYYFEYDQRIFRNLPKCPECVMTHNNYMGTADAKIYRFKENLLWNVDQRGYYSNPRALYMVYQNPEDFGKDAWRQEIQALYNALKLAELSNRILVLPTFRCCDCTKGKCAPPQARCSLMHVLKLNSFNQAYKDRYRESVFWENDKVPESLRASLSNAPVLSVTNAAESTSEKLTLQKDSNLTLNCDNCKHEDLKLWLRKFDDFPVIAFNSVYGNIAPKFTEEAGFKCSNYAQWEVKVPF